MGSKSKKFLITGLPRSRTAWLCALFNMHPDIVCLHEPINEYPNIAAMAAYINDVQRKYVGISDSSIGAYSDFYIRYFDCPILIVKRDRDEAIESYCEFLGFTKEQAEYPFSLIEKGIYEIKKAKRFLEVDFNDLDDTRVIKYVWEHCVPDIEFDEFKCETLQGLIVIQNVYKVLNENKINFGYSKLN